MEVLRTYFKFHFFVNLLFIYQIMYLGSGKRVEFTPNSVTIYDMCDESNIVVGEVNHKSSSYIVSKFIVDFDFTLLLTHADNDNII